LTVAFRRIGDPVNPTFEISSTLYIDLEFAYQINESLGLALGAKNIFDAFPDKIGPPFANRLSVSLPYPRRSAANYEGGSYYLRATYKWN
jgi:iron complex outermembrane receptor protein